MHRYDEVAREGGGRPRQAGRRRPVASDFFDDARSRSPTGERQEDEDEGEGGNDDDHGRHRRRHRSRSRGAERGRGGEDADDHHEHKRRRRDHDGGGGGHHDGGDTGDRPQRRGRHHHHAHSSSSAPTTTPAELPFAARQLSSRHDPELLRPLFAYYLDIQKNLDLDALDPHEQRGRWKSFVHRWNRGELAEGWYDPEMFERIAKEAAAGPGEQPPGPWGEDEEWEEEEEYGEEGEEAGGLRDGTGRQQLQSPPGDREGEHEHEEEDDYGPPPPPPGDLFSSSPSRRRLTDRHRHGPGLPSVSDLDLRREAALEEQQSRLSDLRLARRADRAEQRERLDEILPRAEAGTRERRLEKRALVNEKMRGFRDGAAAGGEMEDVGDRDLMGGGDGIEDFRRASAAQQRKKTERELRREAEARARREEREEKLREWREREEEKLKSLKELARARFG